MENLYRLNEYTGKLPNPKRFPIQGGVISAVKDMPDTFSDGFMMEVLVSGKDKERLKSNMVQEVAFNGINNIIEGLEKSEVILSEAEYIYDTTRITYIIFTPDGEPAAIQVKYYKYFRNRYPKCQFYSKGNILEIIAVKVDNKVVGGCMPIYLDLLSIKGIKEGRK